MFTYYITFFVVFLFVLTAQNNIIISTNNSNNEIVAKKTDSAKLFFALAVIILIFVAGFRYNVGADFLTYYKNWQTYAVEFFDSLLNFKEPGIRFIAYIIDILNGGGKEFIFVTSLITIVLFTSTIYKNTDMLLPATLLYIFLGCWHGAFNGIRQYLAAAIVFAGVRYIKQRKFWKYALIIFIAFLFHSTAILMIFPYFIAYNNISFRNIMLLIAASLVVLFSFSEVLNFAGFITNAENDYLNAGEYITNSVNILRVLVAIAPALFFIILYQNRIITNEQRFWLNMLIINGVLMFATSNSTYLARMGIYTVSYSAIGIPELIKGINPKNKRIVTTFILAAFAAFWLYEISNSYSLNNFRFVFNNI